MPRTVSASFESLPKAEEARRRMRLEGFAAARIAVSRPIAEDPVAGEAPGDSFDNQTGQRDQGHTPYGEATRSGACVLTVAVESDKEAETAEILLRRLGAQRTAQPPAR
jgi:hypothetical protein